MYKIIGSLAGLEIAEMCARSGANCGSLFLDLRFRELVKTLLADHPIHLDPASLAFFMHAFSETDKLAYQGTIDDGKIKLFLTGFIDFISSSNQQVSCLTLTASRSRTWTIPVSD